MIEKKGMQKNLARALGISGQHINDIINRRRRPSPDMAAQLEDLTGIDRRGWLWPDEFHNPLIKKARGHAASMSIRRRKAVHKGTGECSSHSHSCSIEGKGKSLPQNNGPTLSGNS
jgi:hypothetical protein